MQHSIKIYKKLWRWPTLKYSGTWYPRCSIIPGRWVLNFHTHVSCKGMEFLANLRSCCWCFCFVVVVPEKNLVFLSALQCIECKTCSVCGTSDNDHQVHFQSFTFDRQIDFNTDEPNLLPRYQMIFDAFSIEFDTPTGTANPFFPVSSS